MLFLEYLRDPVANDGLVILGATKKFIWESNSSLNEIMGGLDGSWLKMAKEVEATSSSLFSAFGIISCLGIVSQPDVQLLKDAWLKLEEERLVSIVYKDCFSDSTIGELIFRNELDAATISRFCPKKLRVDAESERNIREAVAELEAEASEDRLERVVDVVVDEGQKDWISLVGQGSPGEGVAKISSLDIGLRGGRSAKKEPRVEQESASRPKC